MELSVNLSLLCILCFISAASSAQQTFISIDCGSTVVGSYKDEFSLTWTGDSGYVWTGINAVIPDATTLYKPLTTLRYFPTGKKNCYTISGISQGTKVLVRASFYYGNYDGLSTPPKFDLQFDGNRWQEVVTLPDQPVRHEMIYVTQLENVSVCVAQTLPANVPFISSLELRTLKQDMYTRLLPRYALFTSSRKAFGTDNAVIRYPDDEYDRVWDGYLDDQHAGLTNFTSFAGTIISNVTDDPPAAVLRDAISPVDNTSTLLPIPLSLSSATLSNFFINLYFSEVDPNADRSFVVQLDKKTISDKKTPPFGSTVEFIKENVSLSATSSLQLVTIEKPNRPPLINGLELFLLSPVLVNGTDANDVKSLGKLQGYYPQLQAWSGDPCLPVGYSWEWLNCTSSSPPRVTELYLHDMGLKGTLFDFSALIALQIIDLHNNSLNGMVPEFLGEFPSLAVLNLSFNDFQGTVPNSIVCSQNLILDVTGNPNLFLPQNISCNSTTGNATSSYNPPYWAMKRGAGFVSGVGIVAASFILLSLM